METDKGLIDIQITAQVHRVNPENVDFRESV